VSNDSNRPDGASSASPSRTGTGIFAALFRLVRARLGGGQPAPCRLAVDGLPDDLATLAPGALYTVHVAPRSPECDALVWASARAAHTRHVTVVLARERAQAAARLRELGFSGEPAPGWPRRLNVLAMPDDTSGETPGRDGEGAPPLALARLFGALRALKRFGLRSNALYLVEGAERWFTWRDSDALAREGRLLANWCAARGITMVLLLGPHAGASDADTDTGEHQDPDDAAGSTGRSALNGACAGAARVRRTHGELLWQVDFWRTGRALVTGDMHALRFTEDGRLSVASPEQQGEASHATLIARDEQRVVVSRDVVGEEPWVPREWDVLDGHDAVLAACAGARAATVVLAHRDGAQLEALCAAVHTLRHTCGRALKIAVVERGEVLRHQYELLMLSLGANLVVARDMPFSRIESLLQSLQGQLYTRPLVSDYRTALAASLADTATGYLNVSAFCAHVEGAVARGAVLRLPHVLVRLTLPATLAHVDALAQCKPRRAGDVFTADAAHLYVFLFACRLADANAALARIFGGPVTRIATDIAYLSNEGIAAELKALEASSRRVPAADYSDLFRTAAAVAPDAHAVPASQTQTRSEDEPETVRRAREALRALEEALQTEASKATQGDARAPATRRAVPARMPLAASKN